MSLLPDAPDRASYERLRPDRSRWLAAMRAICARHALPSDQLEPFADGTNVVFAAGARVLKLYPPHWAGLAAAECAVAARLDGRLPVATPRVEAAGDLEGWPYLVESRLPGQPLERVWPTLAPAERLDLAGQLGELLAAVHAQPTGGLPALDADWPRALAERLAGCVARHRAQGAEEHWVARMPAFLAAAAPLAPLEVRPAIVTGDVHGGHLLVERRDRWRLSGLFDFDDAQIGHGEYDLAAAGLIVFPGQAALLRAFLRAYGCPAAALGPALGRRLLAYTLLHRYRPMSWWLAELAPPGPTTLDELAEAIYPLGAPA